MGLNAGSIKAMGDAWIYGKWVQPPSQGRSAKTFFRLLDAAETLLATRSWYEVSVQDIVEVAGASIGSFYNLFTDKTALLHCLDDRLGEECERTVGQVILEMERDAGLRSMGPDIMISMFMRVCIDRCGVIKALDLVSKMTTTTAFTGLGSRFDTALDQFQVCLNRFDPAMAAYPKGALVQALRETFWLTRENILYAVQPVEKTVLQRTLMRHFQASLGESV